MLEVEDTARARQFVEADDLREVMQAAGVVDVPNFYFLDEDSRPSA